MVLYCAWMRLTWFRMLEESLRWEMADGMIAAFSHDSAKLDQIIILISRCI